MNSLGNYLLELPNIRSSGAAVKETSYYGTLANLLNEIGKTLKPRIRCIINLKNQGAGLPDGGIITADQSQKKSNGEPLPGQVPSRGVIEIKSTADDAREVTNIARRIAAIILLEPELDANYEAVKQSAYARPK